MCHILRKPGALARAVAESVLAQGLFTRRSGSRRCLTATAALLLLAAAGPAAWAAPLYWFGDTTPLAWNTNNAGDTNWSTTAPPTNTNAAAPPTSADNAIFADAGEAPLGTVTSIVSASTTVARLQFQHTGTGDSDFHTLQINSGITLTVSGASGGNTMIVGNVNTAGVTTRAVITGATPGVGTLTVNNASNDFLLTQPNNTSPNSTVTLDMSGLGTFNATVNEFRVGTGAGRPVLDLALAATNTIIADAAVFASATGASTSGSIVRLGQTNTLRADKIIVSGARTSATLQFRSGLAGTPTLTIRGKSGGTSRANVWIADQAGNGGYGSGGSSSITGVVDLTAGTPGSLDARVNELIIGRNGAVASSTIGAATGTLTYNAGTLDATTIVLGRSPAFTGPLSAFTDKLTSGTLNVGGGTLVAGTIFLGDVQGHGTPTNTDPSPSSSASGTLNMSGGTGAVNGHVILGRHTSTGTAQATGIVNLSGGTLTVLGDLAEGPGGATSTSTVTITGGTLNVGGGYGGQVVLDTLNLAGPTGTFGVAGHGLPHAIGQYTQSAGTALGLRVNGSGPGLIQAGTASFAAGALIDATAVTPVPAGGSTAVTDQTIWVGGTGTWDSDQADWHRGNPAGYTISTGQSFQFLQAGTLTDGGMALTPAADVDWDLAVTPGAGGTASITRTGAAFSSGPVRAVINSAAADITRTGNLSIAEQAGADATLLDMSAGTLAVSGNVTLASAAAPGQILQTGGTIAIGGSLADGGAGLSTVNVDGGVMTVGGAFAADNLRVGVNGRTASLTVAGGGAVVIGSPAGTSDFWVGYKTSSGVATSTGTADFRGAASLAATLDELGVGVARIGGTPDNPAQGTLLLAPDATIDANTIYVADSTNPGLTGLTSTITFGAGTSNVTVGTFIIGGRKGRGLVDIAPGGTLNLGTASERANLYVGRNNVAGTGAISNGTFDMTGGALNAFFNQLVIGTKDATAAGSVGTLTTGNQANIDANSVILAELANTTGTLNFSGGALSAGSITKGPGTAKFNWIGGRLSVDSFGFDLVQTSADPLAPSVLAPGRTNPVGMTSIAGNYTMDTGTLEIQLSGYDPGDQGIVGAAGDGYGFDLIKVSGNATLVGTLFAEFLGGFVPKLGDAFDVMEVGGTTLDISGLTVMTNGVNLVPEVVPGPGSTLLLQLTAVPEPSGFVLGGLGLLALAGSAVRRRRGGARVV